MAVTVDTYIPFATGAGSSVTVAQWEAMARNWLKDGVILGELNEAQVFADSTGMQVKVQPGRVVVQGHYADWAAQKTLGIAAANASLPRIDRVVARLDLTGSQIALDVVTGTAGSGLAPSLTQNSTTYEMALARVTVPAADSTIDSSQVTDERSFARPHGVEVGDIKLVGYGSPASSAELFLQGQTVSRVAYAGLFALWGTTYGAGDGSTTFALPDMRGRVPVGRNTSDSDFATLGLTGGEKKHTLALSEVPAHSHGGITGTDGPPHVHPLINGGGGLNNSLWGYSVSLAGEGGADPIRYLSWKTPGPGNGGGVSPTTNTVGTIEAGFDTTAVNASNHQHLIATEGGGLPHNVMQPYITLNYAVRAR